nr:ATP-binding cassette domain-containing protein [Neisseria meningitidis]
MFGNHGLCGLLKEGAHEKSPKCLGGNLGDFGEFCKGLSLRDTVCYPDIDKQHPELAEAMNTCRLGYLIDKLDKTDDWQHKLSPGELQRVAFVRALLSQPKIILLDEATAALDEPTEAMLYRALKQKLPDSIIISIGHRSTLNAFHNMHLDVGNVACG